MTKKIAIYGKGGIGKSTIVANIAASYSQKYNVLVIGCDPKADTTRTLYGSRIPTVLSILRENKEPHPDEVVYKGYNDISCVESGGPEPGLAAPAAGL